MSSAVDVDQLTSLEDIQAALDSLSQEEESLVEGLDAMLADGCSVDERLAAIARLAPQQEQVGEDCRELHHLISFTCGLAEKVSFKVRQLDLAKTRVAQCQQRVHDLIDLKVCSEGVVTAMQEEDYERAAALIHRFLAMDESLLRCPGDAGSGVGLESNIATLHEAETRLRGVVARKFDEAVKDEDLASIERYFKLFPLLGMQ